MLQIPHPPHGNLRTLKHPLLKTHPLPGRLLHVADPSKYTIRRVKIESLQRSPYVQNLVRAQRDRIRDRPQKAIARYTRLRRVRVESTRHGEDGIGHEERVMVRGVQHHAAVEMPAADCRRDAGENLGVSILQQFQCCGACTSAIRPDRVGFAHEHWAFEGSGPVGPRSIEVWMTYHNAFDASELGDPIHSLLV